MSTIRTLQYFILCSSLSNANLDNINPSYSKSEKADSVNDEHNAVF